MRVVDRTSNLRFVNVEKQQQVARAPVYKKWSTLNEVKQPLLAVFVTLLSA
jgi:hypothetical protein